MSMAQCANRPPQSSQPGLNRGTPNPPPNTATGAPNPLPQGPQHAFSGMYTSQDHQPGPPCTSHPQTHFPPHPFMYIPPATHPHPQPPPMPPFLQYQWPMPYSYNPFSGFPAMGYGMVMPPFPPNPYLEFPGHMLPQPHPQQVNYRRLNHTQFPAASAPYQNQNRRFQAQHNVSAARETVNSEVQTEPTGTENGYADGSPLVGSESGIVTNSSSATLSDCSRETQSHAALESYTTAASDLEGNHLVGKMGSSEGTVKHGSKNLSTKPDAIQSQTRKPLAAQNGNKVRLDQDSGSFRHVSDGYADTWSMCSSDGIVPVCSSSNREDKVGPKLRRASYSDTSISWVAGAQPLLTSEFPDHSLPKGREKLPSAKDAGVDGRTISRRRRPVAPRSSEEMPDDHEVDLVFSPTASEALRKLLRLPFYIRGTPSGSTTVTDPAVLVDSIVADIHSRNGLSQYTPVHSPNQFQEVPDNELLWDNDEESSLHDEATEKFSGYFQCKRKTYESVWSPESLPPYDPKDWLTRSDLMIGDLLEDSQNDVPAVPSQERRLSHRFSVSAESPPSQCKFPIYLADQLHLNLSHTFPLTTQQDVDTSAPTETFNPQMCEMGVQTPLSKEKQLQSDQGMDPSNALATSTLTEVNICETTLAVGEGVDMDGSSETEAVPSPNQKPCRLTKWRGIGPCSSEQVETPFFNSLTEKRSPSSSPKSLQITNEQLAVGIQNHYAVPSKAHMVDCGIQCTVIQDCCHLCKGHNMGGNKRSTLACSGRANEANAAEEELCENPQSLRNMGSGRTGSKAEVRQHRSNKHYSGRNRPKAWWEETWTGYNARPGKSKGGTGRNSRY